MNRLALVLLALSIGCGGSEQLSSEASTTLTTDILNVVEIDGFSYPIGEEETSSEVSSSGSSGYTILSVTIDPSVPFPLRKVDIRVQQGTDPRNQFTWHRMYYRDRASRGAIILVPARFHHFGQYLLNENGNVMQSLAAVLALGDYEVNGYSPRATGIPPGACSSGVMNCSIMATWGLQSYVNDIDFIRRRVHPHAPVVGGSSLGAGVGFAAVNARPDGYSGLLAWDTIMYSTDPGVVAVNTENCAQLNAQIANGGVYDEMTPSFLKQAVTLGEAFCTQVFGSPNPQGGTPTATLLAPDATHTQFEFAHFPRLVANVQQNMNDVEGVPAFRDGVCAFAGDRTFTANLANYRGPIFAIQEGLAFGGYMAETLALTGSNDITIVDNPAFGHFDSHVNADQVNRVQTPILNWLNHVFP